MRKRIEFTFTTFAFFTFLKPAGFDILGLSTINTFFNIARIIIAAITIFIYLKNFGKISKLIKYESFFFLIIGISTILSNEGFIDFCIFSVSIIAFSMLIELLIKKDIELLIKALFTCYFILITSNLLYMLSMFGFVINIEEELPEIFKENTVVSLLSSVNGTASFIFPALCSAFLLMLSTSKKNIWAWTLLSAAFITELILWSATSLTGVFCITIYALFIYGNKFERHIKPVLVIGAALFISLGVTFFNIQKHFEYIIVDILQKDQTLTGRTTVWQKGYEGFYSSPIWGCGISAGTIDNGFIQLLYIGGIIGTISFIILIIFSLKKFCHKHSTRMEKIFSVVIAAVFLMFMSESWPQFFGLYVILVLAVNAKKIEYKLLCNP